MVGANLDELAAPSADFDFAATAPSAPILTETARSAQFHPPPVR